MAQTSTMGAMGFYQALESSTQQLTVAEQRIGAILLADPRSAPFMRAAEVAKRAGVHESTVVRFAQKLGFSGFIEMREALVADSLSTMDRTISMNEEGERFSLAMVIRAQVQLLESLPERVAQEKIDAIVSAIVDADAVHVMGHGLVMPVVEFLRAKLTGSGIRTSTIMHDGFERARRLATVGPRDFLLIVALGDEYQDLAAQVDMVAADGTAIGLITDEDALMYNHLPEHVVAVPRAQARHGVVVPLIAICYAIHFDLRQHRADVTRELKERAERLHRAGG